MRPLAAPIAAATLCLSTAVVHAQTDPAPQDPASAEPSSEPAEEGPAAPDQEAGARGDGGVAPGGGGAAGGEGGGDGGDGPRGDRGDGSRGRGDGGDRPSRRKRGKLRLLRADAKPSKAWFKGRPATFRYAIAGHRRRDIVIQVKRKGQDPKIVRRFERKDVRPRRTHTVDWDGRVDGGRKYARQGSYKFKVRAKRGPAAEARNAAGKPRAGFFKHKFPVRGPHTYGDGLGAGRGHRGADVFARCGTKLQAARAGSVQHEAYQGSGAARTTSTCTCGAPRATTSARRCEPARPSAGSAPPATRPVVTCTSSCGHRQAGTRAATSSTRCRSCMPGTGSASLEFRPPGGGYARRQEE
jgi:hypothetical protein